MSVSIGLLQVEIQDERYTLNSGVFARSRTWGCNERNGIEKGFVRRHIRIEQQEFHHEDRCPCRPRLVSASLVEIVLLLDGIDIV